MPKSRLFFINKKSNWGKGYAHWQEIKKSLKPKKGEVLELKSVNEATDLLSYHKPELVVIGGGDGSINMLAQAVIKSQVDTVLSILPLGFGNAISYNLGVETAKKAEEALKKGRVKEVDVMETNIKSAPIGLFSISVGFDARVVHEKDHSPLSFNGYIIPAIKSVIAHPKKDLQIIIPGSTVLKAKAASVMISNSPVIGKNFVVAKEAKMDDGYVTVNIFPTKYSYLKNIRFKGYEHPLYHDNSKIVFKTKEIKIKGENYVQIDGDSALAEEALVVKIIPKRLKFLENPKAKK